MSNVNHPSHYTEGPECIEVMKVVFGELQVFQFAMMNAFKYWWRHKNKGGLEDLKKAKWYLDYASESYHSQVPRSNEWAEYDTVFDELYDDIDQKIKEYEVPETGNME